MLVTHSAYHHGLHLIILINGNFFFASPHSREREREYLSLYRRERAIGYEWIKYPYSKRDIASPTQNLGVADCYVF